MDSWFREIPIPRTWRVYLATGFDFRGKNRACFGSIGVPTLASVSYLVTSELTQQDGWKTQDGRMTKKCRVRSGMHSLARHFFAILPS